MRFNSRTRVGATQQAFNLESVDAVSIHAPVWVRLHGCSGTTRRPHVSIHAPVWVRPATGRAFATVSAFQFTHPCGCDQRVQRVQIVPHGFNSRTRVGATQQAFNLESVDAVSIHAPVWVRLHGCSGTTRRPHVSIHAPVWVRPATGRAFATVSAFQFTHPCGCDQRVQRVQIVPHGFNSRTRVGATGMIGRF